MDYVQSGSVEKTAKFLDKGVDPNYHDPDTGGELKVTMLGEADAYTYKKKKNCHELLLSRCCLRSHDILRAFCPISIAFMVAWLNLFSALLSQRMFLFTLFSQGSQAGQEVTKQDFMFCVSKQLYFLLWSVENHVPGLS